MDVSVFYHVCCVCVCVCVCDCVSVYALSTPWHVWLPPFRPGQAVTRQGNQDPVSGLDEAIRDQRAHCTDRKKDRQSDRQIDRKRRKRTQDKLTVMVQK